MQRYDFFPFLQNFSWKKLKIYCCFNTCLQNKGGFVGVHIIIYIICGCPGNAWQGQKPCLRIGGTMPYPASLRNFYTCTRRHRGEMSLTEMCGKAHRGRNRRLGSATMADFFGKSSANWRGLLADARDGHPPTLGGQWSQKPVMEWLLRRREIIRRIDVCQCFLNAKVLHSGETAKLREGF